MGTFKPDHNADTVNTAPMKLGVIADVHANLPALEAVLDDMPPVDQLVCLGDTIGYNPWPQECVELVRNHADLTLKGNHDRYVYRPENAPVNDEAAAGIQYAADHLPDEDKDWLLSLYDSADVDDTELRAVHSHPKYLDRYVMTDQFTEMRQYLDDYAGLLLGHTHIQYSEYVDDRLVLNPGSVGQPRDGDPRAAYAVVNTNDYSVDMHRVPYPIDDVAERIQEVNLPYETAERLYNGT